MIDLRVSMNLSEALAVSDIPTVCQSFPTDLTTGESELEFSGIASLMTLRKNIFKLKNTFDSLATYFSQGLK